MVFKWMEEVLIVSALITGFKSIRGPGRAMEPEETTRTLQYAKIAGKLQPKEIHTLEEAFRNEDLEGMYDVVLKRRKQLKKVLMDSMIFVNDDKDREILLAQMTICNSLKRIRMNCRGNFPTNQLQILWKNLSCSELIR